MKHVGLLVFGLGVAASIGVGQVYAAEKEERCTLATLHGQYMFTGSGTLFPPAFGVTSPATANSAGFHIFNGDGTGMDFVAFSINGIDQHVPSPVPFTYTLNPDCTGTITVVNGPAADMFVAVDGSVGTGLNTYPPGLAFYGGLQPRVGSGR